MKGARTCVVLQALALSACVLGGCGGGATAESVVVPAPGPAEPSATSDAAAPLTGARESAACTPTTRALVSSEPEPGMPVPPRPDVPSVAVSLIASSASGEATMRVEVNAPPTFLGSAPTASHQGFNPLFPMRLQVPESERLDRKRGAHRLIGGAEPISNVGGEDCDVRRELQRTCECGDGVLCQAPIWSSRERRVGVYRGARASIVELRRQRSKGRAQVDGDGDQYASGELHRHGHRLGGSSPSECLPSQPDMSNL
jgi:hypothetical protein